jgi:glycosyltransferase involved in cell wall biosynthesis
MKILWISPSLLHPTERGGQIRSLGTLKELHRRHEIHFVALHRPGDEEGPRRAAEYSSACTAIEHKVVKRGSVAMVPQLVSGLWGRLPLAVSRYGSAELKAAVAQLQRREHFDCVVADFLMAAPNTPRMEEAVLFQHNVEATIWERQAVQSPAWTRWYFAMQARKMKAFEGAMCRQAKAIIAVSDVDARRMKTMYGAERVQSVATGVDLEYFRPAAERKMETDLVFCASMDWMPNIDAMEYFLREILPLIRKQRPGTTLTIAGRSPTAGLKAMAAEMEAVTLTGTVPDMRPYLWGAKVSIVPIRIGGGTRLKIYECMAAGLPVVSTTIGAEGLTYAKDKDMLIADEPESFAAACLELLTDEARRQEVMRTAMELVERSFSWERITVEFEAILEQNRLPADGA